jgi:hypothetical protein
MNTFQIVSIGISFLALMISLITAYNNFYTGFKCELFMQPRIILTQVSGMSAIVIACEIINSGRRSGSIDDIVLMIKYKQTATRSVDRYTFFPKLMKASYNIFETYTQKDFEPFQTISIGEKSRLEKYVIFTAANANFQPLVGDIAVKLFLRLSGDRKWIGSKSQQDFSISAESLNLWLKGKAIIEANTNYEYRDNLMNDRF